MTLINSKWLDIQLFAGEGGTDGGSPGAEGGIGANNSVENTVVDEQAELLALGVPKEVLERRAKRRGNKTTAKATRVPAAETINTPSNKQTPSATEENTTPTTEEPTPPTTNRMSWEEIKKDPEYNKEIQAIVQSRLKNAKAAEDALQKLTPALELLARQHNLDIANMDYDALSKAISEDNSFYEDKAIEMGVSLEEAKKLDQEHRANERTQREEARTLERQRIENHIAKLRSQGEELKKSFPNFDLMKELQNPVFARMTAPNIGISVEDAYYSVHREEIQKASMQIAAQKTAEQISNSIQAGTHRPMENGVNSQAPSVTAFSYRNATKSERDAIKRQIKEAAAEGRIIYPNY